MCKVLAECQTVFAECQTVLAECQTVLAECQTVFAECFGFVLRFYGPVNPMGSSRVRSVYLTTCLFGRLSPLRG